MLTAISLPTVPEKDFHVFIEKINDGRFKENGKIHKCGLEKLKEIQTSLGALNRALDELKSGNLAGQKVALKQAKNIVDICENEKKYPITQKKTELDELKMLLKPVQEQFRKFQLDLNQEKRQQKERKERFERTCRHSKSVLMYNEQIEYDKSPGFNSFLKEFGSRKKENPSIYFSYSCPDSTHPRFDEEGWIKKFLKNLRGHLILLGYSEIKFNTTSSGIGGNVNRSKEEAEKSDYVLLFGTEHFFEEFKEGINVDFIHILRKRIKKPKKCNVIPILLTGDRETALPPGEEFHSIWIWRNCSYMANLIRLHSRLLGADQFYGSFKGKWKKILNDSEELSNFGWYKERKKSIDRLQRQKDEKGLSVLEIHRSAASEVVRQKQLPLDFKSWHTPVVTRAWLGYEALVLSEDHKKKINEILEKLTFQEVELASMPLIENSIGLLVCENRISTEDPLSTLLDRILNQLYVKYLVNIGVNHEEVRSSTLLRLHPYLRSKVFCMEKIAYCILLHGQDGEWIDESFIEKIVYEKKCTLGDITRLGLLNIENQEGRFIYPIFQSYFSASYVARNYEFSDMCSVNVLVKDLWMREQYVDIKSILYLVTEILALSGEEKFLQAFFHDMVVNDRNFAHTLFAECKNSPLLPYQAVSRLEECLNLKY